MIINFGSLNIDYVYSVKNFVKPGETIQCSDYNIYAGGKGLNQSIALSLAGGNVRHAGMIGQEGGFLLDILRASGVDVSIVKKVNARNGHASILVEESGQNCIIIYGGTNRMLDSDYVEMVADNLSIGDIVLLQNETSAISEMIKMASAKGCTIVFNPSPMDDVIQTLPLELVDIFILNEIEGEEMTGEREPDRILDNMGLRFPKARILLTLGKAGMRFFYRGKRFEEGIFDCGAPIDTTAAGDTFIGYYLAGISQGYDDQEAVKHATVASGICVTRLGAAQSIPLVSEVEAMLNSSKLELIKR